MGEPIVDYLAKQNIPLFSPLNVNRLVEEWESDKMGMNGGFMSQSIVTPEIDGAIRPFALFGHYKDEEGLQRAYAIPERLETFVETVKLVANSPILLVLLCSNAYRAVGSTTPSKY